MSEELLSAVLDPESAGGPPRDSNGNPLRRYRTHPFLSRYPQLVGIDSRGVVVFYDGEHVQNALLDGEGSIVSLSENPLWGESPAEHVVNVAEKYGRWRHLDSDVAARVVSAFGSRLASLVPGEGDGGVRFSEHARSRWDERVGEPLDVRSLVERWVPLDVPGWDATIRYDPDTGAVLVVEGSVVVTVFPTLRSLEPDHRERVRTALIARGVYH